MYQQIKDELALTATTLVAVSKTKPVEQILEMYHQGQRIFGENRVQELTTKYEALPKDIEWHLIGHLQRNKVKYIASFVQMIHSIDSLKLLKEVNKRASEHHRTINVLLQFHIAEEDTKFGLDLQEAREIIHSDAFAAMKNIQICGVMGMATFTSDEEQVKREFKALKSIFEVLKSDFIFSFNKSC